MSSICNCPYVWGCWQNQNNLIAAKLKEKEEEKEKKNTAFSE